MYIKDNTAKISFDKCGYADFSVAAAATTIQWAGGPNLLHDFHYGRQDAATEADCGSSSPLPGSSNYVSAMQSKGFSDSELVALANIEAFGVI
jgi:hypothetical protein